MKTSIYTWIFARILNVLAIGGMMLMMASCNDEMYQVERGPYPEPGSTAIAQDKVLWVIVDAAGGLAVQQAINNSQARNLRRMLSHSIYTFDGLANRDESIVVNDTIGWQAIMTGTTDTANQDTTLLQRMKLADADSRSAIWAASEIFYNLYAADADVAYQASSDSEAVSLLVSALASDDEFPDLGIIELNLVEQAGRSAGFYEDDSENATDEVLSAISTVDSQIATIIAALQSRDSYDKENWVVMITSNYGGIQSNEGSNVYEMKDRNIFSMIWSEDFAAELLSEPSQSDLYYDYYVPLFSNNGLNSTASVRNADLFNIDPDSSYTVQFMFREFYTSGNGFGNASGAHTMVSKADGGANSWSQGWKVLWQSNSVRIYCSALNNSSRRVTLSSGVRRDNDWHVLTLVFDREKAHLYTYQDGVSDGRQDDSELNLRFDSRGEPTSDNPLSIGMIANSITSGNTRFSITNLQIYNVALPEDFIVDNYSQTHLEEVQNEYWDNLIGYWPADREEDLYFGTVYDYSQYAEERDGKSDMDITGEWSSSSSWTIGSSLSDNATPLAEDSYYQSVINTVDLAYQTFLWLGVSVSDSWSWEGIARTLPYETLDTD